ncbi:hypothetical protein [Actinomadura gamaensis]|uniref:Extracellular repeat, HAF family n=1 Tax=Actinomadura gamaensis TaxID=1763541 RepID=A0ABV9U1U0_9ACTN
MSINDREEIVGTYDDASGRSHGFLRSNGRYSTIDHPKATGEANSEGLSGTFASGVNDRGEIVGSYVGAHGVIHGFRYARGGFTAVDVAGARETWPFGIDDRGRMTVQTVRPDGSQPQYLLDGGEYTPVAFPGAGLSIVHRLTDHGVIVGVYLDSPEATRQHAFLLDRGAYTRFDVPGAQYTGLNAATDGGVLTGYYVPEGSTTGHGFLTRGGRITSFDAPGAAGTTAYDINDHGQIVGSGFPPTGDGPRSSSLRIPAGHAVRAS